MITFGIPRRSAKASSDWEKVQMFFNRTLWSVYNQTDPDFRVIVACHEKPHLAHSYDERVEFIEVDASIPGDPDAMMRDKGYKVHEIAMRVRALGGGFVMLVDADDIQSNRIAGFANSHQSSNGFYAKNGYFYHVGNGFVKSGSHFPNGSSTIVKYSAEDLPEKHYEPLTSSNNLNPHIIRKRHGDIPRICKELGRPLEPLPFKASIYVRDTGDNHSLMGRGYSKVRLVEQAFRRKIPLSEISDEFSIEWSD